MRGLGPRINDETPHVELAASHTTIKSLSDDNLTLEILRRRRPVARRRVGDYGGEALALSLSRKGKGEENRTA